MVALPTEKNIPGRYEERNNRFPHLYCSVTWLAEQDDRFENDSSENW